MIDVALFLFVFMFYGKYTVDSEDCPFIEAKWVNNTKCLEMPADQIRKVGKHLSGAAKWQLCQEEELTATVLTLSCKKFLTLLKDAMMDSAYLGDYVKPKESDDYTSDVVSNVVVEVGSHNVTVCNVWVGNCWLQWKCTKQW